MNHLLISITENLSSAITARIDSVAALAPSVLGATAVFLFGWILGEICYRMILSLGHKVHLEELAEKVGLKHFLDNQQYKTTPSQVIGHGVKGYLIFFFFIEATDIAGLTEVAEFLNKAINYIPEVLIAVFIMLIGARVGHTVELVTKTSLNFANESTSDALGLAAKYTVIIFAVLAALSQLEIAEILINTLFIGFVAMLTIAGGLSFGLGGKDLVKELLEDIKKVELKKKK